MVQHFKRCKDARNGFVFFLNCSHFVLIKLWIYVSHAWIRVNFDNHLKKSCSVGPQISPFKGKHDQRSVKKIVKKTIFFLWETSFLSRVYKIKTGRVDWAIFGLTIIYLPNVIKTLKKSVCSYSRQHLFFFFWSIRFKIDFNSQTLWRNSNLIFMKLVLNERWWSSLI